MKRQISILLTIFLVLILGLFIFADPLGKQEDDEDKKDLFTFQKEDVASFQIDNYTQAFLFQKKGGDWYVAQSQNELTKKIQKQNEDQTADKQKLKKADPVKVTSLLTTILAIQIDEPIAAEPNSAQIFQINEHSLHVRFYDEKGEMLGRLDVGKQGPDIMSSFIRKNKENEIYLIDQNLQGLLLYPYEEWLIDEVETEQNGKTQEK